MIEKSESGCCPSLWTCGFSTNSNQFPNTHGHPGISSLLTLNPQITKRPHRVRACSLKTVHTSSVDHESFYGHLTSMTCWLRTRGSMTHTSKFNNLFEPLTELSESPLLTVFSYYKAWNSGTKRNGEEAWGKWGSKAAKPPDPLRTLPLQTLDVITSFGSSEPSLHGF